MRRAAKVDRTQAEVVAALRKIGASVQSLAQIGRGCPDALVGLAGETYLLEIKDGALPPSRRRLTPDEERWARCWNGSPVYVVGSAREALALVAGVKNSS